MDFSCRCGAAMMSYYPTPVNLREYDLYLDSELYQHSVTYSDIFTQLFVTLNTCGCLVLHLLHPVQVWPMLLCKISIAPYLYYES